MVAAFQTADSYSGSSRIARVDVLRSMADAEPVWRSLEAVSSLATPYQTFEFLNAWQATVGLDDSVSPFIVVAYDVHNRPVVLLPLVVGRENGVRIARFMGGKHPTFNMPVWQAAFASFATASDVAVIIEAICREDDGIDLLALTQQPKQWRGVAWRGKSVRAACQSTLGQSRAVNDHDSERQARRSHKRVNPAAIAQQGTQTQGSARLSIFGGGNRYRHQAGARRVLHRKAAAHGTIEATECVC